MASATTQPESQPAATQNGSARPRAGSLGAGDGFPSLMWRLQALGYGADYRADAARRTLGITSCTRHEGASTVAMNLAIEAGESGARVLLVDANVAHPALHLVFDADPGPGLTDALGSDPTAGNGRPQPLVQPTKATNVSLVAAGTANGTNPRLPLAGVTDLLERLSPQFDLVLVDLPAADVPSHLVRLAAKLDGVLLVVEAERTSGESAARGKDRLDEIGANLLGVVLNKRRSHLPPWLDRRLSG